MAHLDLEKLLAFKMFCVITYIEMRKHFDDIKATKISKEQCEFEYLITF